MRTENLTTGWRKRQTLILQNRYEVHTKHQAIQLLARVREGQRCPTLLIDKALQLVGETK